MNIRINPTLSLSRHLPFGARKRLSLPMAALVSALAAAPLAGCGTFSSTGTSGYAKGFLGGVAVDEPRAALISRTMLAEGGSAADAAVAAYFTMSVTRPSAASLGAGGACLVLDKQKKTIDALDFTHPVRDGRGVPVPLAPRAMYVLHAKYGALPWTQVVAPSESLARFGHDVSRALAQDLSAAGPRLVEDPAVRDIFAPAGMPLRENAQIVQQDLANSISLIRRQPMRYFTGDLAREVAAAYVRGGANVTAGDFTRTSIAWRQPVTVGDGNEVADFPPTAGGMLAAQMWAALARDGAYRRADADERPHLLVEVARRAFADAGRALRTPDGTVPDMQSLLDRPRIERMMAGYRETGATGAAQAMNAPADGNHGSVSLVTADSAAQTVACAFTMNAVMGAARIAPGTGIVMAAAPGPAGAGRVPLAVMMVRLEGQQLVKFAGTATGGVGAILALERAALDILGGDRRLEETMTAPRFAPVAGGGVAVEDSAAGRTLGAGLVRRGHSVTYVPSLPARMNGFSCPDGFTDRDSACDIRTDRRGYGLVLQN